MIKTIAYKKILIRLIGLVILIIIFSQIDRNVIRDTFANFSILSVIIIITLLLFHIGFKGLRWHSLITAQKIILSRIDSCKLYFAATYLGLVTPGRVGELSKIYFVKKTNPDISYGIITANVLVDRILDVMTVLVVSILGLWYYFETYRSFINTFIAILVILTLLMVWQRKFISNKIIKSILSKANPNGNLSQGLDNFITGVRLIIKSSQLYSALFFHLITFAIFYTMIYYLSSILELNISFVFSSIAVSVAMLAALIPISFAGLGTRDTALIALFSFAGLSNEQAIMFSSSYLVLILVTSAILGFIAYNTNKIKKLLTQNL